MIHFFNPLTAPIIIIHIRHQNTVHETKTPQIHSKAHPGKGPKHVSMHAFTNDIGVGNVNLCTDDAASITEERAHKTVTTTMQPWTNWETPPCSKQFRQRKLMSH